MKDTNELTKHVKWSNYYNIIDPVEWRNISYRPGLSEEFIEEFSDKVYWPGISHVQHLSEEFMRKHKDQIWWQEAAVNQVMSESFIEEFLKDKLSMQDVCMSQKLSEKFIHKYRNKICWDMLFDNKKVYLTNNFIQKHKGSINKYYKIYYGDTYIK